MRSLQSLIQLASLQDVLANIAAQNRCDNYMENKYISQGQHLTIALTRYY